MTLSFLATRRGKITLVVLCAVGFLDFIDASIVNIALPHIKTDLHFSVSGLQWVLSGYLLAYGGFMLLGGRAGDLLGRRRVLIAGLSCSESRRSSAVSPPTPRSWSGPAWPKGSAPR
jgi:MFS family permease